MTMFRLDTNVLVESNISFEIIGVLKQKLASKRGVKSCVNSAHIPCTLFVYKILNKS